MSLCYVQLLLDNLCDLRVREKVLRLTQYSAQAVAPLLSPANRVLAERLSADISLGRFVYRLLEDLPKLRQTLATYRAGQNKGCDVYPAWVLGLLASVCDCLYFPAEQAAWYLQGRPSSQRYKTLATKLWVMSLFLSILRSLLLTHHLSHTQRVMTADEKKQLQRQQLLTLLSSSADLRNGLTFLSQAQPSKTQIGLFGMVSSAVGLYSLLKVKRDQQLLLKGRQ